MAELRSLLGDSIDLETRSPRMSERERPPRFNVLQQCSPAPGLSLRESAKKLPVCQTAPWPNARRRVRTRSAYESASRASPRGRNTVGVVFADSERDSQVALAPVGAPSGLRLRGKEPRRRLPIELGTEVATIGRDRPCRATRDRRAAGRGAIRVAWRSLHGCPVDRKHFSDFAMRAALPRKFRAAKDSTGCRERN